MLSRKDLIEKLRQATREDCSHYGLLEGAMVFLMSLPDSEPEPDLKGWIETGEKPNRRLFHLLSDKMISEEEDDTCTLTYIHAERGQGSGTHKESYDSIKQKIKEAS